MTRLCQYSDLQQITGTARHQPDMLTVCLSIGMTNSIRHLAKLCMPCTAFMIVSGCQIAFHAPLYS